MLVLFACYLAMVFVGLPCLCSGMQVSPTPKSSNEKRIAENFRPVNVSLDEYDMNRPLTLDRNLHIFKWGSYGPRRSNAWMTYGMFKQMLHDFVI